MIWHSACRLPKSHMAIATFFIPQAIIRQLTKDVEESEEKMLAKDTQMRHELEEELHRQRDAEFQRQLQHICSISPATQEMVADFEQQVNTSTAQHLLES